jgi:HEAT repeat protein
MGIAEKRRIAKLLESSDIDSVIEELRQLPAAQVINPLIGALCSSDKTVRWHAITVLGPVMADLAEHDMEAARVVMRRFMWSLNDESGGIGWGVPEAMGEIMSCHNGLALEYVHILIAYMREDGFYLELEQLQRGLMWGVARLAGVKPGLLRARNVVVYLIPYLNSSDSTVRGLAAWGLGLLRAHEAIPGLENLVSEKSLITYYSDRAFVTDTVGGLAEKALASINKAS